jgi:hypothetical protein
VGFLGQRINREAGLELSFEPGYTLIEIGGHLGIHYKTVSKIMKASKRN